MMTRIAPVEGGQKGVIPCPRTTRRGDPPNDRVYNDRRGGRGSADARPPPNRGPEQSIATTWRDASPEYRRETVKERRLEHRAYFGDAKRPGGGGMCRRFVAFAVIEIRIQLFTDSNSNGPNRRTAFQCGTAPSSLPKQDSTASISSLSVEWKRVGGPTCWVPGRKPDRYLSAGLRWTVTRARSRPASR